MVSGRRVSSRLEGEPGDKERVEVQGCYVAMLEEFVWLNSTMTGFIGQKSDAEDFVRLCALLRINVHLCATLAKFDHCCATLSDFVHSRVLLIDFVRLCAGRP